MNYLENFIIAHPLESVTFFFLAGMWVMFEIVKYFYNK